jgi:protein-S-isoprenylcysteine O-methyltransferase Ste14
VADPYGRRLAAVIARWRVAAGYVLGAIALWAAEPTPRTLGVGAAIAVAGEALRIWAAGHLEKGREVTSTGPYAITRHPLYVGSSLIATGLAIASTRVLVGCAVAVYLGVTIAAAIRTEEAHLTEKFGHQYTAYRDGRALGAARRFSAGRVMRNREYRALLGLCTALAVLAWKTTL